MEAHSGMSHLNLEAFTQNLKSLENTYVQTPSNLDLSDLRNDEYYGTYSTYNHAIFGPSEPTPTNNIVEMPSYNPPPERTTLEQLEQSLEKPKKKKRVYPSNLEKNFHCPHCDFATHNKYNLDNHVLRHADPNSTSHILHKCTECSYSSLIKRNVDRHMKKHKEGNILTCERCNFQTVQCHEYKRHLHTHYLINPNQETVSQDSTECAEALFQCDECIFACGNIRALKKHKKNAHKVAKMYHTCDLCDFKTSYKVYLKKHVVLMHFPNEVHMHGCTKCAFTTKWRSCLRKHKQNFHSSTAERRNLIVFKCYNCSFQSIHKGSLRKHMPIHDQRQTVDNRPMLKCEECLYETQRKDSLQRHKKLHLDKKKVYKGRIYECKNCGDQYRSRQKWYRHVHKECVKVKEEPEEEEDIPPQIEPDIKIEEDSSNDSK